jgi:FkbM family methyltransferase
MIAASTNKFVVSMIRKLPLGRVRAFNTYASVASTLGYSEARSWFDCTFECDPNDLVQHRLLFFGIWEPNITDIVRRILRPGDVFVDIGANIGYDTLMASRLVGDTGRVISIEASGKTFEALSGHVKRNGAKNVRLVNNAVSDKDEVIEFFSSLDGSAGNSSRIKQDGMTMEGIVHALPLRTILTQEEVSSIRLVKIDIEGGELPVMTQMLDEIEAYPQDMDILLELSPLNNIDQWNAILSRMRDLGYRIFAVENDYHPRTYIDRTPPAPLRSIVRLEDNEQLDLYITRSNQSIAPTH